MFPHRLNSGQQWEIINGQRAPGAPSVPVEKHPHPTALVVAQQEGLRRDLVFNLRQFGCLVLEAEMASRAMELVISHSRPIQVLLAEKNLDDIGLLETLKRYRPQMHILLVTGDANASGPDVLAVDTALAKTKELLDLPKRRAAAG
jgi:CheY-like chemotaxis protein